MKKYLPSEIEAKWQKKWVEDSLYRVDFSSAKPKKYILVEFAYPSGDLHMGHWFTFVAGDIYARFCRMLGCEVFLPNGFDAFGLPAENAAITRHIHPKDWTYDNIKRMKQQFGSMGASYDWEHEVITSDSKYYRWNQWIFLKMLEKGIAYQGRALANWCPKDQTVLANENIEAGKCWRCGTEVIQKEVEQWFLKITDYADRLIWPQIPSVDWPEAVRAGQNNWIGRSEGVLIKFGEIGVFTTRPDTIFGATFLVISPEHPLLKKLVKAEQKVEVEAYLKQVSKKSELERKENRQKSGVFTGSTVKNPLTGQEIPVWVADYVLMGYGTGAIMAVPAHDQRDFEFAKEFDLPITRVVIPESDQLRGPVGLHPRPMSSPSTTSAALSTSSLRDAGTRRGPPAPATPDLSVSPAALDRAYEGEGTLINSGEYDGMSSAEAREKISDYIEKHHLGQVKINYHLHDWSISRQRYWGTPIPVIHCSECGIVSVPEKDLPVELPYEVDFTPQGKPPLASNKEWLKVTCPKCGGQAERDAETMDTFVDSSWYFFRYLSPD
ncbi:leucine--tRNA ligase, partial [Candidatus Daviesbacteria bacterium]|nr:leucine--tRNA ligase [Candidatus Daviesbacteria bacterium]